MNYNYKDEIYPEKEAWDSGASIADIEKAHSEKVSAVWEMRADFKNALWELTKPQLINLIENNVFELRIQKVQQETKSLRAEAFMRRAKNA